MLFRSVKKRSFNLDRGFDAEFRALFRAITDGGKDPVDFDEYVYTTLVTFKVIEALRTGVPQDIDGSAE
mgnify:FL=1